MKQFGYYIGQVLRRIITPIFAIFDAAGVLVYYATRDIPQVPDYVSALIFAALVFMSGFLVWRDKERERYDLENQLTEFSNAIPYFQLSYTKPKKYSVKGLIAKYQDEIHEIEEVKSRQGTDRRTAQGPFAGLTAVIEQYSRANLLAAQIGGIENREDKLERLNKHLKDLKIFESALKNTYFLGLFIQTNRSDSNIQVDIQSVRPAIFIADDEFISGFLPTTERYEPFRVHSFGHYARPLSEIPNINKPRTDLIYGFNNGISQSVKQINADRKEDLFDEKLFIQSLEPELALKVVISSEKRQTSQHIDLVIPLSDTPIVELTEE